MPNDPPNTPRILSALFCFVITSAAAVPVSAADAIYSYTDDDGVPHYTDQWQLIPEQYRSRIQEIDQSTGKPFKPGSVRPAPAPSRSATRPPLNVRTEPASSPAQREPPFYAAWIEQFSKLSIPLPSQIQLGIGLMSAVLVWGALKVIRLSGNPLVKLMLKGVITIVLVGSAYALYMANLNGRIAGATNASTPQSILGKDVLQNIQGTTEKAKEAIAEKVAAPLEKVKDATAGDAIRTRDAVNQSYREQEKVLNKIESGP